MAVGALLSVTAAAAYRAGDTRTSAYELTAQISIAAGAACGLAAVPYLGLGFRELGFRFTGRPASKWMLPPAALLYGGMLALLATGGLFVPFYFARTESVARQATLFFLIAASAAGVLLLSSLAAPTWFLLARRRVWLSVAAWAIGFASVAGQLYLALQHESDFSVSPDWLTYGGIPLINFNFPYGILAALSATMLARCYRMLANKEKSISPAGFFVQRVPRGVEE